MNDLDDWLNSLGIQEDTVATLVPATTVPTVNDEPVNQERVSNISNDDFNDILADNGFQEPVYEEAEEVIEEPEADITRDREEPRDLDAEEDADWDAAIRQAQVVPVPQISVEEAMEAIQSVNEEYNETNPDEQDLLIPLNSPTLLIDDSTSRFSGAEWYNEIQKAKVILAGCGGIGSWTIIQLARMCPATLFIYDDDSVELANMSGQLYSYTDVGKAKVDAMADMVTAYTSMRNMFAINEKFTRASEAGNIMICGFDSMKARKTFFQSWSTHVSTLPAEEQGKCLFIDGRLSMTDLQVFCITGDNAWAKEEYQEHYLFSDYEADETVCSMKQTTYLACMIGSLIVNLFTNFIANSLNPVISYDLPFFTEYDAQNMIFKTIK